MATDVCDALTPTLVLALAFWFIDADLLSIRLEIYGISQRGEFITAHRSRMKIDFIAIPIWDTNTERFILTT